MLLVITRLLDVELIFTIQLTRDCNFEQCAFWLTTAGIIIGAVAAFFVVYSYLRSRRIF
ncbi:hypothetical protein BHE74_00004778 [Ensete ventricosum]|uniref:Uncharacterized protein n=1 Tax=Ensete ventricosum TaxID=4639 RepID=A0A427ALH8_ENSVE|nr:hypothetical protein B296_00003591 [Ensete ventricosum]RWW86446.1 hypothetical protein BHE74_00004778 [Ensete ventricosum]